MSTHTVRTDWHLPVEAAIVAAGFLIGVNDGFPRGTRVAVAAIAAVAAVAVEAHRRICDGDADYDAVEEFDTNRRDRPAFRVGDEVIVDMFGGGHRGVVTGHGLPVTAARVLRRGDPYAGARGYQVRVPTLDAHHPVAVSEREMRHAPRGGGLA